MLVEGKVEKVSGFQKGNITYWNLTVDGKRYGFGSKQPEAKEGSMVSFEAKQNGEFWNGDIKTLKPLVLDKLVTSSAGQVLGTKPWISDDKRQDAISYQAARNSSLEFVNLLATNGAVEFGAKAKAGDKHDVLLALLDRYTMRFFEDTKRLAPQQPKVVQEPTEATAPKSFDDEIPF